MSLKAIRGRVALFVGAAAAISGVAGMLTPTAASAGTTLTTKGASLMCNVYQTGTFTGYADCQLTDTLADSHQVYAVTQEEAFPTKRYTNSKGFGKTLSFRENFEGDTVHWYWSYKVCRDVQFYEGRDNCSGWQKVQA